LEKAIDLEQIRMGGGKKAALATLRQHIAAQKELERAYMAGEVSQEAFNEKYDADWRRYENLDQQVG
jgi:hypothetical protein